MAKGVYKITNDQTGEVYIGQTNNLYLREKQHMEDLASGSHPNRLGLAPRCFCQDIKS